MLPQIRGGANPDGRIKGVKIGLFSDYYLNQADGTAIAVGISRAGLTAAGHEVHVFCPRVPGTPQTKQVTSFYSLPAFIYTNLRACWPFSRRTLAQIEALDLDVIHIHTPFLVGLAGLRAARKLRRPVVMTAHLDLDFMDGYFVALMAMPFLALLIGIIQRQPTQFLEAIFWPRWRPASGWRRDVAWRTYAFLASQCDLVLAPSQKIYDQLRSHYPGENLVIVPNGVDIPARLPSKAAARKQLGIAARDFVIINSSRHVREKRIDVIIQAFAKVARKAPSARLILLGGGPKDSDLKNLAKSVGLADKLDFIGAVPRPEVFNYLAAADIYTNACLREVASLAVLEAAAVGKPLLLFDERLVEPLADGVNGSFVKSSAELARQACWLANRPATVKALGEASIKRVRVKYGVRNHIAELVKAYKQVC